LASDQPVRRKLPERGRLHVERVLPFITVYRYPAARDDPGTCELVTGGPSYLLARAHGTKQELAEGVQELLDSVVEILAERCGAALVLEVESDPELSPAFEDRPRIVLSHDSPDLGPVVARLKCALEKMPNIDPPFAVEIATPTEGAAQARHDSQTRQIFQIRVRMQPVHYEPHHGTRYPLFLRLLRHRLHWALAEGVHEFTIRFTNVPAQTPNVLARSSLGRRDREIDRKVIEISQSFDFLLDVTPVNTHQAWLDFRSAQFDQAPRFRYRHLAIDPSILKRTLYSIHFHRLEDPDLAELFREQREEIAQKLRMLEQRDTPKFMYGSLQLYGDVDDELLNLAQGLVLAIPPEWGSRSCRFVDAIEFAARARLEIEHYRHQDPTISAGVELHDDVSGLLVAHGKLLVERHLRVSEDRVEALIQHEVGTHLVTFMNGKRQPLRQLGAGLASYEELQEALAVLAEYLVGQLGPARLRLLAGRVLAVRALTNGASFMEAFRQLSGTHGFAPRAAFTIAMRVFRSGGFTKDLIYLRGLKSLLEHMKGGAELKELFVGKIGACHIPLMRNLTERGIVHEAALLPRYFEDERAGARLRRLRRGVTILDLVERPRS
jgi:uncharacterized protein (TIGR02421 family)